LVKKRVQDFGIPFFYQTVLDISVQEGKLMDMKMTDLYKLAKYYNNTSLLKGFHTGKFHVVNILKSCVSSKEFTKIKELWIQKHKTSGSFIFKGNNVIQKKNISNF
jgi:hypothetical protein